MIRGALGWQNHVSSHLLQILYGLCDDWFYISAWLRVPRHLAQHYLDVSVRMCLFMRLTFEWVDWVKQIASLMWVSLTQSAEDWNRTKRLSKREFLLPDFLELGHWSFPAFRNWKIRTNWKISSTWIWSLPAIGLELHHWFSWVSSIWTLDCGAFQPP